MSNTIYYQSLSEGEPLVLIPGFGANHLLWSGILDELTKTYRVILLDNRGTGQSAIGDAVPSIDAMADDVVQVCEKLNITNAHFLGSSMGGMIVQSLAVRYPKLVKTAILSNSATHCDIKFLLFVEAQQDLMQFDIAKQTFIKLSLGWIYSTDFLSHPGKVAALINLISKNPFPTTLAGYQYQLAALKAFHSDEWVQQMNCPTLVMGGGEDLIFNEPSVQALAAKIPHARYYGFEKTGHLPHVEHPRTFVKMLREFTAEVL